MAPSVYVRCRFANAFKTCFLGCAQRVFELTLHLLCASTTDVVSHEISMSLLLTLSSDDCGVLSATPSVIVDVERCTGTCG